MRLRLVEDPVGNTPAQKRRSRLCSEREGWIAEWYIDADGHKSGRFVKNRPGWQQLEKRLADPDVIALISNDSGRMHRKSWRVGYLLDQLDEYGLRLILALQDREYDTSDPTDRLLLTFMAMQDEHYANDIALKAKDSIAYRKAQGKTVGMPPFGTVRNEAGFLIPSSQGAWLLADGTYVPGVAGEEPPQAGALWRGYYECARRILELYGENKGGRERIAYQIVDEGWAFRDRKGQPRPFNKDDIRRVTSNWLQYAGLSPEGQAKTFNPNLIDDPVGLLHDTGRAVFPLELLRKVAQVHQKRGSIRRPPGAQQMAHPYPLTQLLFCAQCERRAEEQANPMLRSRISGANQNGRLRYRHAEGVQCGCGRKSVFTQVIEQDFARLIRLLTIDEETLPVLVDLAAGAEEGGMADEDFEAQKAAAIAKARRRVENARFLFLEGDISQEEYLRRKEHNERQIAHWEARTTESEKATIELAMCMNALDQLAVLWDTAEDEDRQQMARMLFEYVVYDLDRQQIVDFRLKPWADRYLVLRASLYGDDDPGAGDDDDGPGGLPGDSQGHSGTGVSGADSGEKENRSGLKTTNDYCPIGACATRPYSSICAMRPAAWLLSYTSAYSCLSSRFPISPRPNVSATRKFVIGTDVASLWRAWPKCSAFRSSAFRRLCRANADDRNNRREWHRAGNFLT